MTVLTMDHVGITVGDLDAAVEFFVTLGMQVAGRATLEDDFPGRVNGVPHSHVEICMVQTPDQRYQIELSRFLSKADDTPPDAAQINRVGLRHLALVVDDLDAAIAAVRALGYELVAQLVEYEGVWRLCYVRGPEGVIVELAERLGRP